MWLIPSFIYRLNKCIDDKCSERIQTDLASSIKFGCAVKINKQIKCKEKMTMKRCSGLKSILGLLYCIMRSTQLKQIQQYWSLLSLFHSDPKHITEHVVFPQPGLYIWLFLIILLHLLDYWRYRSTTRSFQDLLSKAVLSRSFQVLLVLLISNSILRLEVSVPIESFNVGLLW
jgi:hypothetical protein